MDRTTNDALGDELLNESFCAMSTSGLGPDDSWEHYSDGWESTPNGETLQDSEGGSTSTTAPHPDDIVADGVIGAEYRSMKMAKMEAASATPPRDPYHGRSSEPKLSREPPRESFNLMVVGEAGLGKTTLLESFFKSFKVRLRGRRGPQRPDAGGRARPLPAPLPLPPTRHPPGAPHRPSARRPRDRMTTRPSRSSSARRRTR